MGRPIPDIRQNQPGPAKHAAFKPAGNDLLTIPTYLHFSGKVATRANARPPYTSQSGSCMAVKAKQAEAEVEEAPDDEAAPAAAKPKKKFTLPSMKVMIIAAAGLLVVGGGGTAGYIFFFKAANADPNHATFVDLPDVMVNLSNAGTDRTQYLKVKIVLELPDAKLVTEIQPLMPRVMDAFQTY